MNTPLFVTNSNGNRTAALYSGEVVPTLTGARGATAVGSDVQFATGPGRLIGVVVHQSYLALSGVNGMFYDAAVPVSGGPIAASGHIPLTSINAAAAQIAGSGTLVQAGALLPLNVPFGSGLCYNSRSGQPGVTVVWQTETNLERSGL